MTLACDLACRHCGSRAGRARPDELTTAEALNLVDQMADLGWVTREAAAAADPDASLASTMDAMGRAQRRAATEQSADEKLAELKRRMGK